MGGGRDYERGDRDVRDRDLAVQVLANQVQELSGLVRQVLEGDRDRGRGRHRSASSGRVRGRRSRSRRRVPSPRTPPSIPPPRTPPTPPRPPVRHPYDVKGISWKGSFSTSCMSLMDRPIAGTSTRTFYSWIADSMKLWSNRDRTIWICDPDLPQDVQQSMGIRVDVRIRSHVRNTMITGGKWMRQRGWIKSSFYRPRDSAGAAWDRLQREGPVGENVDLPVTWSDLITFSHRDMRPRAYMGRLVKLSGDQRFEGQYRTKNGAPKRTKNGAPKEPEICPPKQKSICRVERNPPTPPQPSRFMICTDDDVFRGNPKVQTPKTESTDYDTSSSDESSVAKPVKVELSNEKPQPESIKKESCDTSPVGLLARDPDGPNPYEIVLDSDFRC